MARGTLGVLTAALLVLVGISGCLDFDPAGAASCEAMNPEFNDESGAIRGTVVDADGLPLECAKVGSVALGSTYADDQGSFSFSSVAPGDYLLYAAADGFETQQKVVPVVPGGVTEVSFVLGIDAGVIDDPFHETYAELSGFGLAWQHKLTPECVYGPLTRIDPLIKTCGGGHWVGGFDKNSTEFGIGNPGGPRGPEDAEGMLERAWSTLLLESDFDPNQTSRSDGLTIEIIFPNATRNLDGQGPGAVDQTSPHVFTNIDDDFALALRVERQDVVDRELVEDDQYGDVRGVSFPAWNGLGTHEIGPDVGWAVDEEFTMWVTIAYHGEVLPESFSAMS